MLRRSESTNGIKTSKERVRFNTQFFVRQMGRPREFTADLRARLLPAVTLRTEGASGNFDPKLGFDVLYDGRPGGRAQSWTVTPCGPRERTAQRSQGDRAGGVRGIGSAGRMGRGKEERLRRRFQKLSGRHRKGHLKPLENRVAPSNGSSKWPCRPAADVKGIFAFLLPPSPAFSSR